MLNNIRNKPTKELYKTQSYVLNLALYIWLFLTHVRSVPIKNYTSTFEVKSFHLNYHVTRSYMLNNIGNKPRK